MTTRRAVIGTLEEIAFACELLNDRRGRTFSNAARAIRDLDGDLFDMLDDGSLANVRGIGQATLEIVKAVRTGQEPQRLTDLRARVPTGLFSVRRIKGLGTKKIKALWDELRIESLAELEYACRENRLIDLTGFGFKTQERVLEELVRVRETEGAVRRDQAKARLLEVQTALMEHPGIEEAAFCGDYVRGTEVVRNLKLLVRGSAVAEATRAAQNVIVASPAVDIVEAPASAWGAQLVFHGSSDEHLALLKARARDRGLRFGTEGLFEGDEPVAVLTDSGLYEALGLVPTPPERREAAVPLVDRGQSRPRLVRFEDLKGALHNHTLASDGKNTLEEMRDAAAAAGLSYFGISEHSQTASYAGGLSPHTLLSQVAAIEMLNDDGEARCALLSGVESDILERGDLDYEDTVLAELDFVVASVHRRFSQNHKAMTERMIRAAGCPWTTVIGHPTGRLLLGRSPSEYDIDRFLAACARSGCAVELNSHPQRLDFGSSILARAKEAGVLVSIAADAHSVREIKHLEYGVSVARRAGLTPQDVLNTRSLPELRSWLEQRQARAHQALGTNLA